MFVAPNALSSTFCSPTQFGHIFEVKRFEMKPRISTSLVVT